MEEALPAETLLPYRDHFFPPVNEKRAAPFVAANIYPQAEPVRAPSPYLNRRSLTRDLCNEGYYTGLTRQMGLRLAAPVRHEGDASQEIYQVR